MGEDPYAIPAIETVRLRLRPLSVGDAEALHSHYADEAAMTWWSHGPHVTVGQTREKLADNLAGDWRAWAITKQGDDTAIGTVGTHEKRQGGVSEIGYSLVRAHWGQGLAREAVAAVVDRTFAEGQRRVYADVDPDNAASNALLRRLGFTLEGRLRGEWETHIGIRDSLIWGVLEDEWRRARPRT